MSLSLKIDTQRSNLQMEAKDAKLDISGQDAKMDVQVEKGDFKVRQKSDTLEINNYPAFKQLNSYKLQDLMEKVNEESKQKTSEAINRYVQDGDAMMKIENKGTPLIEIAKQHANTVGKTNLNVTHFPKEPIEISVKKGYLDIEAIPDKVSTNVQKNLRIEVTPGGVYTTLDKLPKVNVEVVGEQIDSKV